MAREGEVRKRLVGNEQTVDEWDVRTKAWKKKVLLTFEFNSWDEAVNWMNNLEAALERSEREIALFPEAEE